MWKKTILISASIILLAAALGGWRFFTSNTSFTEKTKYLYVLTEHATYEDVYATIRDSNFVKNPASFNFLAHRLGLPAKIKPGRYEIRKGMSLFDIVRELRNGRQTAVNLVITKLRTKENLASFLGRRLECDSADVMQFMSNEDSLKEYGFDTNTVMTMVFPNTYTCFWNTPVDAVFRKFLDEYKNYWTPERRQLAQQHGLTPATAYILASIVEEETNYKPEKGTIASVYLNRYNKGDRLQADPTVKFALHDFGLKRIYDYHTSVESPYNTYRNKGFPPGPICTPSIETMDSVLNSPSTNYYYFVAKSDFSGSHFFSENYKDHLKYARDFHKAEDTQDHKRKAAKEDIGKQK